MNEFDLISTYFAGDGGAVLGIGDDAAVVSVPPGQHLAVAVDTVIAGRHFPPGTPAEAIGHRSLAVNLSDLAAMGALPRWYTLALTLPDADPEFLAPFSRGIRTLAQRFDCALVGGDTTRGPLSITVQALGLVSGTGLTRRGARVGDRILVGRELGGAAAGLDDVRSGHLDTALATAFLWPTPQVELGLALADIATAAIDVSDGLLADLGHVLDQSRVGAEIRLPSIPVPEALARQVGPDQARQLALTGGDDYALCFTVPRDTDVATLPGGIEIGRVCSTPGIRVVNAEGIECPQDGDGYRHF